jgi:hypothetical protein
LSPEHLANPGALGKARRRRTVGLMK